VIAFRPEASLVYINAESVLESVLDRLRTAPAVRLVVCDLSAAPYLDLAGCEGKEREQAKALAPAEYTAELGWYLVRRP
jgi:MFS superfamily sulfate permease-like transporter